MSDEAKPLSNAEFVERKRRFFAHNGDDTGCRYANQALDRLEAAEARVKELEAFGSDVSIHIRRIEYRGAKALETQRHWDQLRDYVITHFPPDIYRESEHHSEKVKAMTDLDELEKLLATAQASPFIRGIFHGGIFDGEGKECSLDTSVESARALIAELRELRKQIDWRVSEGGGFRRQRDDAWKKLDELKAELDKVTDFKVKVRTILLQLEELSFDSPHWHIGLAPIETRRELADKWIEINALLQETEVPHE